MSYDISLTDPETGETLFADEPHGCRGGTYAAGDRELWLDVTYNYSGDFSRVLGKNGIRSIYGLTGEQSIPILERAAKKLQGPVSDNYWDPTPGNARQAIETLLTLAKLAPHGIWKGD